MSLGHRREIDGLRAVAVVPVILFHAGYAPFSGGYVGVDIFFVISGYLITAILLEDLAAGRFSIRQFYIRRARRILPALFFMLAVTMAIGALAVSGGIPLMLPFEVRDLGKTLTSVVFFVSNIVLWQKSGYFAAAAERDPLVHTWSLAVEEQFYLLFPPALWLLWRFGFRAVFWASGLVFLGSLGLAEYLSTRLPAANFFLLPTRVWELLAGALVAQWGQGRPAELPRAVAEALGIFGLLAIGLAIFLFDDTTPVPSVLGLVPVLGTVAIILGASAQTRVGRLLGARPLVGIGLISYSAYLWHQPLLAFARLSQETADLPAALTVILIVITFSIAWFSWAVIERPFRRPDHECARRIVPMAALTGAGLVAVAAVLVASQGLPQRFPAYQRPWIISTPGENAAYVTAGYARALRRGLARDRPNLVIVGDSFSQDLFNMIVENGGFSGYAVTTLPVPARCQLHYGLGRDELDSFIAPEDRRLCARGFLDTEAVAMIRQAEVVFFASKWQMWSAARFAASLRAMALPERTRVFVLGPKSFAPNRRALLRLPADRIRQARFPVSPEIRAINDTLRTSLAAGQFVDLLENICPQGCPLFDTEGRLLSYDGAHLTRAGACMIGAQMLELPILAGFAGDERGCAWPGI